MKYSNIGLSFLLETPFLNQYYNSFLKIRMFCIRYGTVRVIFANLIPISGRFVAAWEPKPSRMLNLELTDGFQTIRAVERHPVGQLC